MMKFSRGTALAIILSLTVGRAVPFAHAIDEGDEVFKNEYIITASVAPALRRKAVDVLDGITSLDLEIADESPRAILLQTEQTLAGADEREVTPYDKRRDLCERLRARQRTERLDRIRNESHEIIRRISCGPNAVLSIDATPSDPYYSLQWGADQANDIDMDLGAAWDISTGEPHSGDPVVIAIIDTGIDYTHSDLAANMWHNPGEIAGNGIDDDGNGYIDDVYGINAITRTGDPYDDHGHGTHVAGTIGAVAQNGIGVVGVSWNVKLMGTKFLSSSGSGSTYDAITAVDYITMMKNRGVNVVASNNSWGGGGYSQPLADAITRAQAAGILFVAAAGNSSNNNDANPHYPSSYTHTSIISVAAVDSSGNLASFSCYGASSVDVGAPGVSIASTYPGNRYVYMNGTSMATPHVSGAIALLRGYNPGLTWQQTRDLILNTGVQLGSLSGKTATGRMVNGYNMLVGAPPPGPTPTPTVTPTPTNTPTPTPSPTPTNTPTPTPTPVPGWWTVGGAVTDGTGAPLRDVKLVLQTGNGSRQVRVSGDNGSFRFDNVLGPTTYTVTATKAGYQFEVASGMLNSDQSLSLVGTHRSFAVSGTVVMPDGALVAGVNISAGSYGSGVSDSNGRFSISVPYGVSYTLTYDAPGYKFTRPSLSRIVLGDVDHVIVATN